MLCWIFISGLTFHPLECEQDFADVLRVIWGALNCSVESLPTVSVVSIRPKDKELKKLIQIISGTPNTSCGSKRISTSFPFCLVLHTFQGYSTPATCWHILHSLLSRCCPTALWPFGCFCSGGPGRRRKQVFICADSFHITHVTVRLYNSKYT